MTGDLLSKASHWRLFLHTGLNMNAEQLLGALERKGRHAVVPRLPVDFDQWYERNVPETPRVDSRLIAENNEALRANLPVAERNRYRNLTRDALDGTFRFTETLSVEDPFEMPWEWDHPVIDGLAGPGASDLHGFLPVSWAVRGFEKPPEGVDRLFRRWVRDWSEHNEIGDEAYLRRAWTPYTVSLRVRHWSRYCAWRTAASLPPDDELRRAIFKNALFLERHIESDVGGNHLAENGIALLFAGLLFRGHDASSQWIDTGIDVLTAVAREQFLDDGGHFERSSMYHVLVAERLLSALGLLDSASLPYPNRLREVTAAAAAFVADLRGPDGSLPLLNDAVRDRAISPEACLRYAEHVGLRPRRRDDDALPDSGYYWFGTEENRLLVDGGPVGPPHLPGHSHNDMLQVLLWLDGRPVVTDTGTLYYEPDAARQYARGVRGHNTVQVGDAEPIEIGGRFLMGRRTKPATVYADDDVSVLDGRYAVRSAGSDYRHRRRVVGGTSWWFVWDRVTTQTPDTIHSRLHFHPDLSLDLSDAQTEVRATGPDGLEAWVYPLGADAVVGGNGPYFPRFGERITRPVVDIRKCDAERATFGYLLSADRYRSVSVEAANGTANALSLNGSSHPLPDLALVERDGT